MTPIIHDAHLDLAWNALTFGRDYTKSAHDLRRIEQTQDNAAPKVSGLATVGLPDLLRGRVGVVTATLFTALAAQEFGEWDIVCYETPAQAHDQARRQIDYYEELAGRCDQIELVRTRRELGAVLKTWEGWVEPEVLDGEAVLDETEGKDDPRRVGIILSMEGADPILEPAQVEEWYAWGLRAVGPAWSATRYAGGTHAPGPLTDLGRELLDAMAGLNMALDLSHLAEEAYFQAVERYEGAALVASHSNPRRFCPTDRGLSDEMIALLAERDGVIGVVPYNGFLKPGWTMWRDRKEEVTMDDVIAAIDHICQVTGSARHAGLGSDFDGGFGAQHIPVEFDTIADLWKVGDALRARGFGDDDVAAVLGGNFLRVYRLCLPE
ncbi:MAG: membrane dipeptidase [Anaerolineae bacterium]|nr:membrane dipeptidase [Anaerolineae bacterium]